MKLVLIGGGGHCKSVLDSVITCKKYESIFITDKNDEYNKLSICKKYYVGGDDILPELFEHGCHHAIITVGSISSTALRRKLVKRAKEVGFYFESIIDKNAILAQDIMIEEGSYIGKRAIINSETHIGRHAIINTGAIIEHECEVGDYSHVAVGAVICGGCSVGKDVFIGANSTIIQGIKIGAKSVIGAGSLVLKDVPENTIVCGTWKGI